MTEILGTGAVPGWVYQDGDGLALLIRWDNDIGYCLDDEGEWREVRLQLRWSQRVH